MTLTGVDQVELGNLSLDLRNFQTRVDGKVIDLTYQEFELVRFLVSEADHVLAYDAFTQHLWGTAGYTAYRRLNVMMHRVRAKLAGLQPYEIRTVRGRGYGLVQL